MTKIMKNNFVILDEGNKFLFPSLICLVISILFGHLLFVLVFLCIITLVYFLYRNPHRESIRREGEILSICDGTIQSIDYVDNLIKISTNVKIYDIHILRSPLDGLMKIKKNSSGAYLNPNTYNALKLNGVFEFEIGSINIGLQSGINHKKVNTLNGTLLTKGDVIGIFFGGIVDIEIKNNNNFKLNVSIGDKIQAGQTVIAFNKQENNNE